MYRFIYTLILYSLLPFIVLRLGWRGRANSAYRQRWRERFALKRFNVPKQAQAVIVLHAVSVGETMAARPLVEQLLKTYPEHCIYLTSTTPTGSSTVQRLFGERVTHSYLPYDLPGAVARFLDQVRPCLFLVMETELWPNLYAGCAQRGIPLMLVNARLSTRSVRGYQRVAGLVNQTLQAVQLIAAREQQDAQYFQQLGAAAERIQVCGNIKFDLSFPEQALQQAQAWRQQWGTRPVWVAASTHAGEDEQLLKIHAQLRQRWPDLLLILVPRHPERFEAVAALCAAESLTLVRRSQQATPQPNATTAVLLGDSMGELQSWYAAADMAFIGGSLVDVGGHNPLEAAWCAVPTLTGPYSHNFVDIYPPLIAAGGAVQVESASDLADHLAAWLTNPSERQEAGRAAQQFMQAQQGVVVQLMSHIQSLMSNYNVR